MGASRDDELLSEDRIQHIAGFLAPDDLLAASRVNTYWQEICARDAVWRRLCVSRWLLRRPDGILRTSGTEGFMELYMYLARNRFLPQGKYTSKQVVWGKARQEGADAWITVVHTPDCRIPNRRGSTYIQLRVAVQNLHTQPMLVGLQELQVRFKNGDPGKILGVSKNTESPGAMGQPLSPLAPSLVAINGVDVLPAASRRSVELNMFDIAVIAVNVECDGCEFETDFLESCGALWIPIRRMGKCASLARCRCGLIPDSYHHGSIRVPIVDESVIWKYYTLISGRFMVFDARTSQELWLFESPTHRNSLPSRSRRKKSIS